MKIRFHYKTKCLSINFIFHDYVRTSFPDHPPNPQHPPPQQGQSRGRAGFKLSHYNVTIHRRKHEGFGFVIISSVKLSENAPGNVTILFPVK